MAQKGIVIPPEMLLRNDREEISRWLDEAVAKARADEDAAQARAAETAAKAAEAAAKTEESRKALERDLREAYQAPVLGEAAIAALRLAKAKSVVFTYAIASETFTGTSEPLMVAYAGGKAADKASGDASTGKDMSNRGSGSSKPSIVLPGETLHAAYDRVIVDYPEEYSSDKSLIDTLAANRLAKNIADGKTGNLIDANKIRGSVETQVWRARLNKIEKMLANA